MTRPVYSLIGSIIVGIGSIMFAKAAFNLIDSPGELNVNGFLVMVFSFVFACVGISVIGYAYPPNHYYSRKDPLILGVDLKEKVTVTRSQPKTETTSSQTTPPATS
jgi:hypothetical protein